MELINLKEEKFTQYFIILDTFSILFKVEAFLKKLEYAYTIGPAPRELCTSCKIAIRVEVKSDVNTNGIYILKIIKGISVYNKIGDEYKLLFN